MLMELKVGNYSLTPSSTPSYQHYFKKHRWCHWSGQGRSPRFVGIVLFSSKRHVFITKTRKQEWMRNMYFQKCIYGHLQCIMSVTRKLIWTFIWLTYSKLLSRLWYSIITLSDNVQKGGDLNNLEAWVFMRMKTHAYFKL